MKKSIREASFVMGPNSDGISSYNGSSERMLGPNGFISSKKGTTDSGLEWAMKKFGVVFEECNKAPKAKKRLTESMHSGWDVEYSEGGECWTAMNEKLGVFEDFDTEEEAWDFAESYDPDDNEDFLYDEDF